MSELFRLGVLGVAKDTESRVLLVRVTYGRRGWQLPGGFLERPESPEDGLKREFREELCAEVCVEGLLGVYYKAYESNLALVFGCRVVSSVLTANRHEIDDFGYYSLHNLPDGVSDRTRTILNAASVSSSLPFVFTFEQP